LKARWVKSRSGLKFIGREVDIEWERVVGLGRKKGGSGHEQAGYSFIVDGVMDG